MTRRTPSARERGSIMIFAVGVLVLMAVLAAVFLTSTQNERQAGLATRNVSEKQQLGASLWMDHVAGVIGRDVFDPINDGTVYSMVDLSFSQLFLGAPPINGMTAEFERWDYPYTRPGTIGTANFNTGGDDPWLADIDPRPATLAGDVLGDHLNAGSYASFDVDATYWHMSKVHPQGVFVRIGVDETGSYTDDPSVYSFVTPTNRPDQPDGVVGSSSIFIADMSSDGASYLSAPTDVEFADTDGDGRYDSRWTKLDFADPLGMTIYGAVRIIDLSGLFNVNVHQEFSTTIGPGTTPADVDLLRMLLRTDYASEFGVDLLAEGEDAYRALLEGLGFRATDVPADVYGGTSAGTPDSTWPLQSPQNRFSSYSFFGATPNWLAADGPNVLMFSPFGLDDEIELRAFAGLNTGAVRSRLERTMDYADIDDDGPLRSGLAFADELANRPLDPRLAMIDLRHRMTTQSKARRLTPQVGREARRYGTPIGVEPTILRTSDPLIDDAYFLPYKPESDADREAQLRGAFGAFARALAPYALDQRTAWGTTYDYLHYGWDLLTVSDPESAAQHAIRTAAHMAVNAVDLFNDHDEPPTSVRLTYGRNNDPGTAEYGLSLIDATDNPTNPVLPPGTNRSVHVYGIVPEPNFVEAATVVIYKDQAGDDSSDVFIPGVDIWQRGVDPGDPDESAFKALYVELRNPYEDPITIDASNPDTVYEIRFGTDPYRIPLDFLDGAVTMQGEGFGADEDRIIIEVLNSKLLGDAGMLTRIRDAIGIPSGDANLRIRQLATPKLDEDVLNHDHGQIELWRRVREVPEEWMLVDVMRADSSVAFPNDPTIGNPEVIGANAPDGGIIAYDAVIKRNADLTSGDERPVYMIEDPTRNGSGSANFRTFETEGPGYDPYFGLAGFSDRSYLDAMEVGQTAKSQLVTPFATEPFQLLHVEQDTLTGLTRVGDVGNIPCIGPLLLDPVNPDDASNWITTSQQLARRIQNEDGTVVPAYQTMYADVLSFRHSVVDGYDPASTGNEQQLMPALPIATRIFDYFQPDFGRPGQALMTPWAGMININTAPYEVLRMLPTAQPDDVTWTSAPTTNHDFAATMVSYRDRRPLGTHGLSLVSFPTYGAKRNTVNQLLDGDPREEPGFASIGELLLLFQDSTGPVDGAVDVFELGGDEASGIGGVNVDILDDDIADDAEERNLLFSNLSNMITVRSDTFCVYLRLRGYRPGDDLGRPTMDERWIAIIDRSNVVRPSDKPRILLMQRVE
jgi:hypothetical protein